MGGFQNRQTFLLNNLPPSNHATESGCIVDNQEVTPSRREVGDLLNWRDIPISLIYPATGVLSVIAWSTVTLAGRLSEIHSPGGGRSRS